MARERTHRAVAPDGTEIVGRVEGEGPPLVLVHGAVADGDSEWGALLPRLTDRFTCYLPSTRGRGSSAAHPDHSREARVQDVTAFVDSIGEPVALVGVSGGGMLVLGAASRTTNVVAVGAYEPVVFESMDDGTWADYRAALEAMEAAVAAGSPLEAAGAFLEWVANDEEVAAVSEAEDGVDEIVRYRPSTSRSSGRRSPSRAPAPPTRPACGASTCRCWC